MACSADGLLCGILGERPPGKYLAEVVRETRAMEVQEAVALVPLCDEVGREVEKVEGALTAGGRCCLCMHAHGKPPLAYVTGCHSSLHRLQLKTNL